MSDNIPNDIQQWMIYDMNMFVGGQEMEGAIAMYKKLSEDRINWEEVMKLRFNNLLESARQTAQIESDFRDKIIENLKAELESIRKERESYRGALEKLKGWTFATSDAVHSVITNTLAKYPTEQTDKPPLSHE